jgi:hypothetical protein
MATNDGLHPSPGLLDMTMTLLAHRRGLAPTTSTAVSRCRRAERP